MHCPWFTPLCPMAPTVFLLHRRCNGVWIPSALGSNLLSTYHPCSLTDCGFLLLFSVIKSNLTACMPHSRGRRLNARIPHTQGNSGAWVRVFVGVRRTYLIEQHSFEDHRSARVHRPIYATRVQQTLNPALRSTGLRLWVAITRIACHDGTYSLSSVLPHGPPRILTNPFNTTQQWHCNRDFGFWRHLADFDMTASTHFSPPLCSSLVNISIALTRWLMPNL